MVPIRQLQTRLGGDAVKNLFKFKASGINPETGDLVFQGGAVVLPEQQTPTWINSLSVNERRVTLQIDGTSDEANRAYGHVTEAFSAFNPGKQQEWGHPLTLVEETTCVATFNFTWEDLFGSGVVSFINGSLLQALSTEDGTAYVKTPSLRFTIGYLASEAMQRAGISLVDKLFAIEPRVDTPLSERRFFTASPLGTEQHIGVLEEFEASVVKSRKKR